MKSISVTLDVSELDKSSDVRLEQPSNMQNISVTLDVFQFDKSSDVRLEHS